jgi:basic membrane protein A
MHVDGPKVVVETAAKRGKMVCGYHASQAKLAPNAYLTGAEWNWLTAYTTFIEAARSRQAAPQLPARRPEGRLREDVRLRPHGAGRREEAGRRHQGQMVAGTFDIFKGPLKDNKGNVVIPPASR